MDRQLAARAGRAAAADRAERRGEPDAGGDVRAADDASGPDVLSARRRAREGGSRIDGGEPGDADAIPRSSRRGVRHVAAVAHEAPREAVQVDPPPIARPVRPAEVRRTPQDGIWRAAARLAAWSPARLGRSEARSGSTLEARRVRSDRGAARLGGAPP